jgi:hypothetical protein
LTESWAIGSESERRNRDDSVQEQVWKVAIRKLMKSFLVHFGGFKCLQSPFWVIHSRMCSLKT